MLSSKARAALRRQWLDDLEAEIALRAAVPEAANDAARQRFIDQLYQMADRVASVVLTAGPASPEELAQAEVDAARGTWGRNIDRVRVALVDDLVATNGDWDRIDKLCVTADWAPADAIAMVLTRDRKLAMRMLNRWCREHGYSRRPAWPRWRERNLRTWDFFRAIGQNGRREVLMGKQKQDCAHPARSTR